MIFEEPKSRYDGRRKKIEYEIIDGCWVCTSHYTGKDGYAKVFRNGRHTFAHRYVYEIWNGKTIQEGKLIMHSCDNPSCINPEHLSEGLYQDNAIDMFQKGRSANQKITIHTARDIKRIYHEENIRLKERLAEQYGLSMKSINAILNGDKWDEEKYLGG